MEIKRFVMGEDVALAETEIPDALDLDGSGGTDYFGFHRFVDGVKSASRRSEIIMTNLLVKELFGGGYELCHEPSGKPYLNKEGSRSGLFVSISHCRGAVVLAYSARRPIGVDVERTGDRAARVREKFLSDEELRFTGLSPWKNTLAWTAKEAVFKCMRENGSDFREQIALDLSAVEDDAPSCEFKAEAFGRRYTLRSRYDGERITTLAVAEEG